MTVQAAGRGIEMQKTVSIGGQNYMLTAFQPTRSIKLLVRLTKLVGEPLAMMAGKEGELSAANALPVAVRALVNKMDEDDTVELIQMLMACVSKNKKMIDVDIEFAKRLGDLMKLLKEIVEFQFEDFFAALGESLQSGKGMGVA